MKGSEKRGTPKFVTLLRNVSKYLLILSLYGLQGMSSDKHEVGIVLKALADKMNEAEEPMNVQVGLEVSRC
jgi:hypothetical protein